MHVGLQVAVTYIPAPSFILFCQLSSCAAYVKLSAMAGFIEAEGLEWGKSKKFALIVFGFIGTLFSNVTSLRVCACTHTQPASGMRHARFAASTGRMLTCTALCTRTEGALHGERGWAHPGHAALLYSRP